MLWSDKWPSDMRNDGASEPFSRHCPTRISGALTCTLRSMFKALFTAKAMWSRAAAVSSLTLFPALAIIVFRKTLCSGIANDVKNCIAAGSIAIRTGWTRTPHLTSVPGSFGGCMSKSTSASEVSLACGDRISSGFDGTSGFVHITSCRVVVRCMPPGVLNFWYPTEILFSDREHVRSSPASNVRHMLPKFTRTLCQMKVFGNSTGGLSSSSGSTPHALAISSSVGCFSEVCDDPHKYEPHERFFGSGCLGCSWAACCLMSLASFWYTLLRMRMSSWRGNERSRNTSRRSFVLRARTNSL
eukprot:PhM_4_TR823/c0_g1_i1/m.4806